MFTFYIFIPNCLLHDHISKVEYYPFTIRNIEQLHGAEYFISVVTIVKFVLDLRSDISMFVRLFIQKPKRSDDSLSFRFYSSNPYLIKSYFICFNAVYF